MNLASRPAPLTSGPTNSVLPPATTNVLPGSNAACNHTSNQANNMRKSGNTALMSLFGSGRTMPRQMMVQARGAQNNQDVTIQLNFVGTIGQGTFGQIERATLNMHPEPNGEQIDPKNTDSSEYAPLQVAVKRVLQDPRYKNRELSIMQRLNNHPNVVRFFYYYYSTAPSNSRSHRSSNRGGSGNSALDLFLHLVLECFPESLCELIYRHVQRDVKLPTHMVKVFTYQMLKALAYLHSHQICHRDIKSSNLLVDESTLVLKVCDFGSAKEMVPGAANVSYISSRYYRAPELLFGAQLYTCAIDTWSGGCVLAEMLRQRCLFMGSDSVDQLVKVIRVLGTPSLEDIASMNPLYRSYNFPQLLPCPVSLFFPQRTPADLLDLMRTMLVFNPSLRISPSAALSDPCFDELRELGPNGLLPGRVRMPVHIFDQNPDPITAVTDSDTTVGASSNNWAHPDARSWHDAVGKKPADTVVGNEEKKKKSNNSKVPPPPHETVVDWPNRKILGSDKTGCSTSVHPVSMPNQSGVETLTGANKPGDGVPFGKNSTKRDENTSSGSRRLIEVDSVTKSDCNALSNGGNESRNPSTLNQSFKFGTVAGTTVSSEVSEVEQLNEIPG